MERKDFESYRKVVKTLGLVRQTKYNFVFKTLLKFKISAKMIVFK